jgi:hypothetical protein
LKKVNGTPLINERLVFDNNIVGTYQSKFRKENACEIIFDTHNYRRPQFKELLERLLQGLMSRANIPIHGILNITSKETMNQYIRYYHR